jgi:WD40 repeat protein
MRRHHVPLLLVVACALAIDVPTPPALAASPPHTDLYGDPLPDGAVARLGTVRWRTNLRLGSFSPDGQTVVSLGDVGLVLWDARTGRPVGWSPQDVTVKAAAFSADGKTLIIAGRAAGGGRGAPRAPAAVRRLIRRYEVGTGKLLDAAELTTPGTDRAPSPHGDSLTFARDGQLLLAGDGGKTIRLWDAASGKPLQQVTTEFNYFWPHVAVTGDGKLMAVAQRVPGVAPAGVLHVYDLTTGRLVRRLDGDDYLVYPALSPDGKVLVASASRSWRAWDVATGALRHEAEGQRGPAAFSPDGRYLAVGASPAIRLYDAATFREVRRFAAHGERWVHALAFSPDGKRLASGLDNRVALWDVATGEPVAPLPGHGGPVVGLAFSPDGQSLASGGDTDGTAYVWDVATGRARHQFAGHDRAAASVAFSPDGATLATGDGNPESSIDANEAQIRLWDLKAGRLLRQFTGHLSAVHSLAWSPDGTALASAGGDARARLWEVATGRRLAQARGGYGRRAVSFSADGHALLVANYNGELALWGSDLAGKLHDLGEPGDPGGRRREIAFAALTRDGKAAFSLERDRRRSPDELRRQNAGSGPRPRSECELRVWDAATGHLVRTIDTESSLVLNGIAPYALSPDGKVFAQVADNHREAVIQLYDTDAGKLLAELRGHTAWVTALALSPDGRTLASGSWDTTVLLWDVGRVRLELLWAEWLAGEKDARAAARRLAADPGPGVAPIQERLARAAAAEKGVARLFAGLDDDSFEARERATKELGELGPEAAYALRRALEGDVSPEARIRAGRVLEEIGRRHGDAARYSPQRVRVALSLLEQIESPQAGKALEELAAGDAAATVTRQAKAALERRRQRGAARGQE